jgi:hypothetical protein
MNGNVMRYTRSALSLYVKLDLELAGFRYIYMCMSKNDETIDVMISMRIKCVE